MSGPALGGARAHTHELPALEKMNHAHACSWFARRTLKARFRLDIGTRSGDPRANYDPVRRLGRGKTGSASGG